MEAFYLISGPMPRGAMIAAMRRELLTFDVDPPVRTVQADHDVAKLVTLVRLPIRVVDGAVTHRTP